MLRSIFKRLVVYSMPESMHVDVCIIGAGPAGLVAAFRAGLFGKTVCLVESHRIGGNDFWRGTLQSKMWWEMGKLAARLRGGTGARVFAKPSMEQEIDEERMRAALIDAAVFREGQIKAHLDECGIKMVYGHGMFTSPENVEVLDDEAGKCTSISADYFLIATGAAPRTHVQYPPDGDVIVTSEHIMQQPLPESIVVVGGGVIGVEFASTLANIGKTQVHLLERHTRILPHEDDDVADFMRSLLERKNVCFHTHAQLQKLRVVTDPETQKKQASYSIKNLTTGERSTHCVDRALIAIGRDPNYSGLGLETTNCRLEHGRLCPDQYMRCLPHRHIYACGDSIGLLGAMHVNAAERQARDCIDHMFGTKEQKPKNYDNLSSIMFMDQEIAAVGMTEQVCKTKNIGYTVARYGYRYVNRALAMHFTKGFVKILVTNDREKRVLGVRAVGPHASSVVELASLAIHNGESAYSLCRLLPAYPAITQGFQECVRMLLGTSALKHEVFDELHMSSWSPANLERGRAYTTPNKPPVNPSPHFPGVDVRMPK